MRGSVVKPICKNRRHGRLQFRKAKEGTSLEGQRDKGIGWGWGDPSGVSKQPTQMRRGNRNMEGPEIIISSYVQEWQHSPKKGPAPSYLPTFHGWQKAHAPGNPHLMD